MALGSHGSNRCGISLDRRFPTPVGSGDRAPRSAARFRRFVVDLTTGSFSGRFTAVGGTGDLTSLQGQGTFEGTGITGTYTLRITFAA